MSNNNCCQPFHPLSAPNPCDNSFADNTSYFEDIEELRQFIIDREANRKLEDLINVEDGIGDYDEGLILYFNPDNSTWTIAESFAPIEW